MEELRKSRDILVRFLAPLPPFWKILGISLAAHLLFIIVFRGFIIHSQPARPFPNTRFSVVDLPAESQGPGASPGTERFYRVPTESVQVSDQEASRPGAGGGAVAVGSEDKNVSLFEQYVKAGRGRMDFFGWKPAEAKGATVFLIDISGSMLQHSGTSTRLVQAYDELKRALAALEPEQEFNLILFAETVNSFSPQPARASRENVLQAYRYLDSNVDCGGSTNLQAALRNAVAMKPDTIVLLTDGLPTSSEPRAILSEAKYLREKNGKATEIHAVGFHLKGGSPEEAFLKNLTKENNGTYVRWNP